MVVLMSSVGNRALHLQAYPASPALLHLLWLAYASMQSGLLRLAIAHVLRQSPPQEVSNDSSTRQYYLRTRGRGKGENTNLSF